LFGAGLITILFNFFRYASPMNLFYFDPAFRVSHWQDRLSSFLGLWVSPVGGILVFWPLLSCLLVFSGFSLSRPRIRSSAMIAYWGALVLLSGLTASLSLWFSPFGWDCWGPRLMLPWIPAILFLLASTCVREADRA